MDFRRLLPFLQILLFVLRIPESKRELAQKNKLHESRIAELRIWTLESGGVFRAQGFHFLRQMLCGEASRTLLVRFLSTRAVFLWLSELCNGVWESQALKPQIINNENHHLALFE